jgi:hypothetical protein
MRKHKPYHAGMLIQHQGEGCRGPDAVDDMRGQSAVISSDQSNSFASIPRSTVSLPTMSRNVIAPSRGITATPQPATPAPSAPLPRRIAIRFGSCNGR